MTDCWSQDPDERPSFQRLYNRLDEMLEQQGDYFDLAIKDESKYFYSKQDSTTSEADEGDNADIESTPNVSMASLAISVSFIQMSRCIWPKFVRSSYSEACANITFILAGVKPSKH